jgi:hypothetical protein
VQGFANDIGSGTVLSSGAPDRRRGRLTSRPPEVRPIPSLAILSFPGMVRVEV